MKEALISPAKGGKSQLQTCFMNQTTGTKYKLHSVKWSSISLAHPKAGFYFPVLPIFKTVTNPSFPLRIEEIVSALPLLSSSSASDSNLLYICLVIRTRIFGLCFPALILKTARLSFLRCYKNSGDLCLCGFCILPPQSQLGFSFSKSNDYYNIFQEKEMNRCFIR